VKEEIPIRDSQPETVDELRRELHLRFDALSLDAGPLPGNRKDQLDLERLRSLGYVE
jgi:hypothetical protein